MPIQPAAPENPRASRPRVFLGKVVTMNGRVIDQGAVYCRAGEIHAVQPASGKRPAGFEAAVEIATGGTIYPGLIDLHNHLGYNILPLWKPTKQFGDRYEWREDCSYQAEIGAVLKVMKKTLSPEIIRYVELKQVIGGVTSSQGISLTQGPDYRGMVRNLESTGNASYPEIQHQREDWRRLALLENKLPAAQAEMRNAVRAAHRYFHHLAEGRNARARQAFLDVMAEKFPSSRYVGIHCTALSAEDIQAYAAADANLVWSPLSNLLLYGETLEVKALLASTIKWGLGSDWSPSGTKNLLGEMKVAWLVAKSKGVKLSYEDLAKAVTIRAASIVGWENKVGQLAAGFSADLLVLQSRFEDPFKNLCLATERDVLLTAIEGIPRYGDTALMQAAGLPAAGLNAYKVAGRNRLIYTDHPDSPPKMAGVSIESAVKKLTEAMSDLHALKAQPNNFIAEAAPALEIELEWDEDLPGIGDDKLALNLAREIEPPKSVELDPLTVVDDPKFFDRIEAANDKLEFLEEFRAFYL